jgi:hypothetical protein
LILQKETIRVMNFRMKAFISGSCGRAPLQERGGGESGEPMKTEFFYSKRP